MISRILCRDLQLLRKIANKAAGAEKAKRWNKISVEAAKQCGRGRIPKVCEPVSFEEAVQMMQKFDMPIMPYEVLGHQGKQGLKELLASDKEAKTFGIMIGPEGGFSDVEAELAMSRGVNAVGLGRRILRTETVSGALIPMIMFDRNEI